MLAASTAKESPARLMRGRNSVVGLIRQLLDPVLIVLTLVGSTLLSGAGFSAKELVLGMMAFALTFPGEVSLRRLKQNLLPNIVISWLLVFGLMVFIGYATKFLWQFDPRTLLVWFVSTPLVLYAAHRIIPALAPQLLAIDGYRTAVVVCANEAGRRLARSFVDEPTFGVRFQGFFDDAADTRHLSEGPLLGPTSAAARFVRDRGIESVFIALPMAAQPQVLGLLDELKDTTASVYFVPDIFITDLVQARIDDVNGVPILAVCETPFAGVDSLTKSLSDVTLAATLLVLLSPLLLAIAAAVKFTSSGPVIFRQRRYGLDGREIVVYKFRTMRVTEDGAEIRQATPDDPRVTPLGRILRRLSLDELPQLINVLQRRMSMVGPRPHAVAHNELYRRLIKGYMMRHKVMPGITGWAQVNGCRGETRNVEAMRLRIEYDLEYLRRWSLGLDLLILWKTAVIVLRGTNAH
jgi:putative colanic acid biosynthesis UDP-glucose lipid carrier transferase